MARPTRILMGIVIATYFGFFLVEALLWTVPRVNGILLPQLNPAIPVPAGQQVEVLRALFLNQGAYNLLLALGGLYGLRAWARGSIPVGFTLSVFLCLFAIGASLTLLATTHAYALGFLQLLFPIAALPLLRRDARR